MIPANIEILLAAQKVVAQSIQRQALPQTEEATKENLKKTSHEIASIFSQALIPVTDGPK